MACKIKSVGILYLVFACHFAFSKTINVSQEGEHKSIKGAIANASPFDTILVKSGHYIEYDIRIDKPLYIIGNKRPIIDGDHKSEIITIMSDSVLIQGFQIQNVGFSFIKYCAAIKIDT
jgi:nitrous oxidase accessory protein